ncbi:MAG: RDD family protein [Flavobacterium sp.]
MSQLAIVTTQNVTIHFQAASVGDRILAYVLDWLIKIAYAISVYFVFFVAVGIEDWANTLDNWSQISVYIIFYFPVIFYSLLFESIFEGQTLGKKMMKTKVVKIDGYQATFGDYIIRWLFRLIDISTNSGMIGLIAMISSSKTQRLGDMAAGTAVISLQNKVDINHTILQEIQGDYQPIYPQVIKLSDNDVRIIKESFERSVVQRDYQTLIKLREKIEQVAGITNKMGNDMDFIRTVLKDYNYYTHSM